MCRPLVDTSGNDPYDAKWGMIFTEMKQLDGPPPYSDVSELKKQPKELVTSFTGEVDEKRVPVILEDEDERDVENVNIMHNPIYTTFVGPPAIEEEIKGVNHHSAYHNPNFHEGGRDEEKSDDEMKITLFEEPKRHDNKKVITTEISTPNGMVVLNLSIENDAST